MYRRALTTFVSAIAILSTNPLVSQAQTSTESHEEWEKRQRLVESAIRCEYLLRPLWEELLVMASDPDFQLRLMASDIAKEWEKKVYAAQDKDLPPELSDYERLKHSQCARDFTMIGAESPGFFIPIELFDAVWAFDTPPYAASTLKAEQIEKWLAWAATLEP